MQELNNPIYSTGQFQHIAVKRVICKKQTAFQEIEVFDTEKFGRCLVIDGIVQAAEYDHQLYDAILAAPINQTHRHVLILGGGDGFVAQAALVKNPSLKLTIVEIDQDVINVARECFRQTVFEDRRVELVVSDAAVYLKQVSRQKFDVILFDLTDNPSSGDESCSAFSEFYREAFQNASMALAPDGLVAVQAGASHVASTFLDSASILHDIMTRYFSCIREESIFIPSFGEECSFLVGQKLIGDNPCI